MNCDNSDSEEFENFQILNYQNWGSQLLKRQEWEESAKNFIDDRVASVKSAIQSKIHNMLATYVSKTNRWDLEEMRLDLTAYTSRRFPASASATMAD